MHLLLSAPLPHGLTETERKEENDGKVARYFERHGYERIERYRAFDAVNSYFERTTHEGADGS